MQLLPLAFSIAGLGVFAYCRHCSSLARKALQWPSTTGRVIASFVETTNDEGDRSESAVFAYEFQVAGVTFQSTDVYPGWNFSWSTNISGVSGARQLVRQFPLDSTVKVYYSPKDPTRSCLYPGRPGGPQVGMVLSLVVSAIALVYAIVA